MNSKPFRKVVLAGLLLLPLLITASIMQQEGEGENWCVSPDGSPVGCAEIALSSETMTADFYLGEVLLAQQQNPGRLILTPNQSHTIDVRNIQSTEEQFGVLYVYADTSTNVYPLEGQISKITVYPQKSYIRGTLNLTCDIRNVAEGDSVACQVVIDEVPQEEALLPGTKADYILDPGDHTVAVNLVGEMAMLWDPASHSEVVSITAGRTSYMRPRFDKRAHLILVLDQPDVLADFYINGELVAAQVPTFEQWVAPYKSYKVEAKNITDPLAGEVYRWRDATSTQYLSPGQERTVTFKLQKEFLQGFLKVQCNLPSVQPTDIVGCRVTIDEVVQEGDLPPGSEVTYTLQKGQHAVKVELVGEHAFLWAPAVHEQTVTITAGRTVTVNPRYTKSAHVIVNLDQPGVVADFYVDDELVVQQVPAFDMWVVPNKNYKIEARNVVDPAAAGIYYWEGTTKYVYAAADKEYTVTVPLTKVYLKGFIAITCEVENWNPDIPFYCQPYIDGVPVEGVPPGGTVIYAVDPGEHHVAVVGGPEWLWIGGVQEWFVTVVAGKTVNITAHRVLYY
jgi:hypothetical protein